MRFVLTLAVPLCLIAASGCTGWKPVSTPAPGRVSQARVTSVENAVLLLRDVEVTADSVTGWHEAGAGPLQPGHRQRIAMHRSEVRQFERGETDVVKTGFLAVLAGCTAALAHYLSRLSV
jgi:hypothetical protein